MNRAFEKELSRALARFYTGQVNIRCLNWNMPHMQESVVRW